MGTQGREVEGPDLGGAGAEQRAISTEGDATGLKVTERDDEEAGIRESENLEDSGDWDTEEPGICRESSTRRLDPAGAHGSPAIEGSSLGEVLNEITPAGSVAGLSAAALGADVSRRMRRGHTGEGTNNSDDWEDRSSEEFEIGLAAGGRVEQKIDKDIFGIESWDTARYGRVYVHIVNSKMYRRITGNPPPLTPIDAATYTAHGLPWFRYYGEGYGRATLFGRLFRRLFGGRTQPGTGSVPPAPILAQVKSVKQLDDDRGLPARPEDTTVNVPQSQIESIGPGDGLVRDGRW